MLSVDPGGEHLLKRTAVHSVDQYLRHVAPQYHARDISSGAVNRQSDEIGIFERSGDIVGFVRKFRPKRGYTFPWQAFAPAPPWGASVAPRLLGSFYGRTGMKQAVDAVVSNEGRK